jgi:hypothetical protein
MKQYNKERLNLVHFFKELTIERQYKQHTSGLPAENRKSSKSPCRRHYYVFFVGRYKQRSRRLVPIAILLAMLGDCSGKLKSMRIAANDQSFPAKHTHSTTCLGLYRFNSLFLYGVLNCPEVVVHARPLRSSAWHAMFTYRASSSRDSI